MNIVITGCSKGIGLELCKLFCLDNNITVVGISRTAVGNEIITDLGENSVFFSLQFDLECITTDFSESILKLIPEVDILINNAGFLVNKPIEQLSEADFDKMFNINVKAVFKTIQVLLPYFSKPSHIVNISSMGGFQGSAKFPGLSLYSSSKGALNTLTECLAEELKDRQIRVNSLSLGAVNTEMLQNAFPGYIAPVQPIEMAAYIKHFAENSHYYLNGKIIPVSISTP